MPHLRALFCRHKKPPDPKPPLVQAPAEGIQDGLDRKPAGSSGLERDLTAGSACAFSQVSVVGVDVVPTGVDFIQGGVGEVRLDEQKSLWDRAYDFLKKKDPALVTQYEKLLSEKLGVGGNSPPGITLGREQLQAIIDENLQRPRGDKRDRLSQATKVVLWAKDWIGEATRASPEASIAWTAISFVLPLLTNPATAQEANTDGFMYVTSRMGFYSAFESVSLRRLGSDVDKGLLEEITGHVVGLFQHVLDFQIRSVLRFHARWRALGRDMLGLDDWEGKLEKIKEFEHVLNRDLELVNDFALREELCEIEATSKASLGHLQNLLGVHHEHLDVAKAQLEFQQLAAKQRLTDKEHECHQAFRLMEGNNDVSYEWYKNRVEDRVEGTCQWLLQLETFGEWMGRKSGPLLVSADPGCGKSVLAKYLIDHVLPGSAPVCYFFFKDQDQNTVRQALCALLHQLFHHKPGLVKHAMSDFISDGAALPRNATKMWEILGSAVRDPDVGQVILVLDALDECLELEFRELVKGIKALYRAGSEEQHSVKWLFTCRPYERIVSEFRELLQEFPHIHIPGEEKSEMISKEVNQVIQHKVRQLTAQKELSKAVEERLLERLAGITHRTYLWVYLVFDHLKASDFRKTPKGVEAAIKSLPENVNQAYENLLNRAGEDKRPTIRKALKIVIAAQRPLSLAEMNIAMAVDESFQKLGDFDLEDERHFYTRLRSWCGLFLSVYQGKVYFLHQTGREFLMASMQSPGFAPHSTLCWQGSNNFVEAHREIASACVTYINILTAAFGREGLNRLCKEESKYAPGNELGPLQAFMDYSLLHWAVHVREADLSRDDTLVIATAELYNSGVPVWHEEKTRASYLFDPQWTGISKSKYTVATSFEHDSILNLFLENGNGTLNVTDRILHMAVRRSSEKMVRFWIERRADLEAGAGEEGTPLLEAIRMIDLPMVTLLLDSGANIDAYDKNGQGALHIACAEPYHQCSMEDITNLLLSRGADTESRDVTGLTPLHCLFESANPFVDRNGNFDLGIEASVKNIIRALVEKGADLEARDNQGRTPLFCLAASDRFEEHDSFDMQEFLEKISAGTIYADMENMETVGAQAFLSNVLDFIISRGAEVEARDNNGRTVLHRAAAFDDEALVLALLDRGADKEAKDSQGQTPLHSACSSNGPATGAIYWLIRRGADYETRDHEGRTPLQLLLL